MTKKIVDSRCGEFVDEERNYYIGIGYLTLDGSRILQDERTGKFYKITKYEEDNEEYEPLEIEAIENSAVDWESCQDGLEIEMCEE